MEYGGARGCANQDPTGTITGRMETFGSTVGGIVRGKNPTGYEKMMGGWGGDDVGKRGRTGKCEKTSDSLHTMVNDAKENLVSKALEHDVPSLNGRNRQTTFQILGLTEDYKDFGGHVIFAGANEGKRHLRGGGK